MVICKVIGGLGNQMFCYAFARTLQLKTQDTLLLDSQVYKWDELRDFSLNVLSIPNDVIRDDALKLSNFSRRYFDTTQRLYNTLIYNPGRKIFHTDIINHNIFRFLSFLGLYYNLDRYYYPIFLNKRRTKYTYGYFQSEKYFKEYASQIKSELRVGVAPTPNELTMIDTITQTNSIGVHIRWGKDYSSSNLNVCNKDYYYKAMDVIANRIENPTFYIFSDCIDEVKQTFSFDYPVHFIEGFKDYESLRLLYSCKHFVIANSSFSWWGAYLSEYEKKLVVVPNKWHLNSTKKPDIYLDDMILVEA